MVYQLNKGNGPTKQPSTLKTEGKEDLASSQYAVEEGNEALRILFETSFVIDEEADGAYTGLLRLAWCKDINRH